MPGRPYRIFSCSLGRSEPEPKSRADRPTLHGFDTEMNGSTYILSRSEPSTYIQFHAPLLDELAGFLGIEEKPSDKGALLGHPRVTATEPRPLSLSFGLQMLVESYNSFSFPKKNDLGGDQQSISREVRRCRVQSLQFAAEVSFQTE